MDAGRRRRLPGAQLGAAPSLGLRLSRVAFCRRHRRMMSAPCRDAVAGIIRSRRFRARRAAAPAPHLRAISAARGAVHGGGDHDLADAEAARSWSNGSSRTSTRSRPSPSATARPRPTSTQPWVQRLGQDDAAATSSPSSTPPACARTFSPTRSAPSSRRSELVHQDRSTRRAPIPLTASPIPPSAPTWCAAWIASAMRRAPFYLGAWFALWYLFAKAMQALLLVLAALIAARTLRFGSAVHRRRLRLDAGGAARLRAVVRQAAGAGLLAGVRGDRDDLRHPRRAARRGGPAQRLRHAVNALLVLLALLAPQRALPSLTTTAAASGFTRTGRYDEVVRLCHDFARAHRRVTLRDLRSIGRAPPDGRAHRRRARQADARGPGRHPRRRDRRQGRRLPRPRASSSTASSAAWRSTRSASSSSQCSTSTGTSASAPTTAPTRSAPRRWAGAPRRRTSTSTATTSRPRRPRCAPCSRCCSARIRPSTSICTSPTAPSSSTTSPSWSRRSMASPMRAPGLAGRGGVAARQRQAAAHRAAAPADRRLLSARS